MGPTLPGGVVLPLRDYIDEFCADMGMLDDQHYSTTEVISAMIEAARGANSGLDLNEVVEHFANQHTIAYIAPARQFLGTLGCCIEKTIDDFRFRGADGRFPYILAGEAAGVYYMEKIQT